MATRKMKLASRHITAQYPPSPPPAEHRCVLIIQNGKIKQPVVSEPNKWATTGTPSPPALLRQDIMLPPENVKNRIYLDPPVLTPDNTPTKDSHRTDVANTSGGSDSSVLEEHAYAKPSPPAKEKHSKANTKPKKRTGAAGKKRVTSKKTLSAQSPARTPLKTKKAKALENNTKVTDFFPCRRSNRKTAKQLKKEKQDDLEQAIINNCEDGLQVVDILGKGRGVVSTKPFSQGEFVVEYAGDLISLGAAKDRECQYSLSPETGCYMYYFKHNSKSYCIDATAESGKLGRLLNHSRYGNCCTKVVDVDGTPRLILVAARDITVGEELQYDYGDRSKESIEAHPWLAL